MLCREILACSTSPVNSMAGGGHGVCLLEPPATRSLPTLTGCAPATSTPFRTQPCVDLPSPSPQGLAFGLDVLTALLFLTWPIVVAIGRLPSLCFIPGPAQVSSFCLFPASRPTFMQQGTSASRAAVHPYYPHKPGISYSSPRRVHKCYVKTSAFWPDRRPPV